MEKLSLNFFGEQVEVKIPETLASLRKDISDKFLFSPSDTAELIISYAKDLGKKIIETENDFKEFVKNKVFKIDLDVDKNSQIFQKSLIKLQTETETDKKELETLISKCNELKEQKESKVSEAKKKIDELFQKEQEVKKQKKELIVKLNAEINKYKNEIHKIKKKVEAETKQIKKEENELNKKMDDIKIKLGIPIEKKKKKGKKEKKEKKEKKLKSCMKPKKKDKKSSVKKVNESEKNEILETINNWGDNIKKHTKEITDNLSKKYEEYKQILVPNEEKEKEKEKEKEIHWRFICDGCGMAPIKGIRYHCEECKDFDFCEKCHKDKKDAHSHKFLAVEKSINHAPRRGLRHPRIVSSLNVHRGVACDGCGARPIIGNRYKCVICPNFDYCEECEKKLYKEHSHPMVQIPSPEMKLYAIEGKCQEEYKMESQNEQADIIHTGISCDGCEAENIVGTRYKCAVCQNFDYCEKCLKEHSKEHSHPFIKIYHPKMNLVSLKVLVNEDCPVYDYSNSKKIIKKEEKIPEEPKIEKPSHKGITCDGCGISPIVGCRYKCAICQNFDYCELCEEKFYSEHKHPFIKIYNPEMKIASIKCVVKPDCPVYQKEK